MCLSGADINRSETLPLAQSNDMLGRSRTFNRWLATLSRSSPILDAVRALGAAAYTHPHHVARPVVSGVSRGVGRMVVCGETGWWPCSAAASQTIKDYCWNGGGCCLPGEHGKNFSLWAKWDGVHAHVRGVASSPFAGEDPNSVTSKPSREKPESCGSVSSLSAHGEDAAQRHDSSEQGELGEAVSAIVDDAQAGGSCDGMAEVSGLEEEQIVTDGSLASADAPIVHPIVGNTEGTKELTLLESLMGEERSEAALRAEKATFNEVYEAISATVSGKDMISNPELPFVRLFGKAATVENFVRAFELLKEDHSVRAGLKPDWWYPDAVGRAMMVSARLCGGIELALDVLKQAPVLHLRIAQRHFLPVLQHCGRQCPGETQAVWEVAKEIRHKEPLGKVAFSVIRCYLDNSMLEEARRVNAEVHAGDLLARMSPGVEKNLALVFDGKRTWKLPANKKGVEKAKEALAI